MIIIWKQKHVIAVNKIYQLINFIKTREKKMVIITTVKYVKTLGKKKILSSINR